MATRRIPRSEHERPRRAPCGPRGSRARGSRPAKHRGRPRAPNRATRRARAPPPRRGALPTGRVAAPAQDRDRPGRPPPPRADWAMRPAAGTRRALLPAPGAWRPRASSRRARDRGSRCGSTRRSAGVVLGVLGSRGRPTRSGPHATLVESRISSCITQLCRPESAAGSPCRPAPGRSASRPDPPGVLDGVGARDRPLLARLLDGRPRSSRAWKSSRRSSLLGDLGHHVVHALPGREAARALLALPAPTDLGAVPGQARVDDLGLFVVGAVRAAHGSASESSQRSAIEREAPAERLDLRRGSASRLALVVRMPLQDPGDELRRSPASPERPCRASSPPACRCAPPT